MGERKPVSEMSDREIAEETLENMRACFDMFAQIHDAVQSGGIGGIFRALAPSGK